MAGEQGRPPSQAPPREAGKGVVAVAEGQPSREDVGSTEEMDEAGEKGCSAGARDS